MSTNRDNTPYTNKKSHSEDSVTEDLDLDTEESNLEDQVTDH